MPDWITHLGAAYLLSRLPGTEKKHLPVLLAGSIAPDLNKAFLILNQFAGQTQFHLPLSTPLGAFLLAVIFSSLFTRPEKVFPPFFLGALLHIALDSLMFPWGGSGSALFFPISMEEYSLGLFWPDNLLPMAVTTGLVAVVLMFNRLKPQGHI